MRKITILLSLIVSLTGYAQENSLTIENYSLGNKDLVILPFGMDQKIIIGSVDSQGHLRFDWSKFDISKMNNTEVFLGTLQSAIGLYCDEEIGGDGSLEGIQMVSGGEMYVYNDSYWEGVLIPASNPELKDHLLDVYGSDAVPGQYLKWVYSDRDAKFTGSCKTTKTYTDEIQAEEVKQFDLDLKEGLNMVLFEIQEVIPIPDAAATPTKIKVTTTETFPSNIIWYLKPF